MGVIVDCTSEESRTAIDLVKKHKLDFLQLHGEKAIREFFADQELCTLPHYCVVNVSSEKDLEKCLLAFANRNHPIEETMHHIWEDPWFAQSVYQRWKELLDAGIQQYLLEKIDSLRNVIYQSQQENFKQWSITEPIFSFERHLYHDTYDEYVNDLKKFINHHIPFMTEEFYNHYIVTKNNSIHFPPVSTNNVLYNLDGKIVNTPVKHGIYIKNHQKIIY